MISMFVVLLLINYRIFWKDRHNIVIKKPKFFSSHGLSRSIIILWFLVTTSVMFWVPFFVKDILDRCH
jgi:hypothetical protein